MSEHALPSLLALRVEAVERARRALQHATRGREVAEQAWTAARRVLLANEAALSEAREGFAAASSVSALRWAEARRHALRAEHTRLSGRVQHAERARELAQHEHAARQRELVAAQVARRAVDRSIERRAADVVRRTEQRAEDELDDSLRSRHSVGKAALLREH